MVKKIGKFVKQPDGTIAFVHEKGQINDCQCILAAADKVFEEVEGKTVSVIIDID